MEGMLRHWRILVSVLCLTTLLSAQETPKTSLNSPVKGYLVDMLCTRERAKEGVKLGEVHTKMCLQMPNCVASGYAVMTPGYQILTFDSKGNQKAKQLIDRTNQSSNFIVLVSGKIKGNQIDVKKIELVKAD